MWHHENRLHRRPLPGIHRRRSPRQHPEGTGRAGAVDTAYLDSDLEFLRRSDAVLMLPGWEKSEGSCQERLEALADIIPVYFSIEELQARETEVAS